MDTPDEVRSALRIAVRNGYGVVLKKAAIGRLKGQYVVICSIPEPKSRTYDSLDAALDAFFEGSQQ